MPTPARPSRSPSTRIGPATSCSSSSRSTPAGRTVKVEERQVGRTRFEKADIDAVDGRLPAGADRQPGRSQADPDLVLDVRLVGRPPRRARPGPRRGRGRPRPGLPQGPRSRRQPAGPDRGHPARRRTRSRAPSSATWRRASPSSRRAPTRAPPAPTRPPNCATRCDSVGCCWPVTRSRCEDPPTPGPRPPPLPRARHRPVAPA